jgi:tetratricopeptide (TPR) repeat protein
MPKQQLDDALEQLVTAELIFRRGTPPDAEYTFKHALVQDTAYGTLLRSRRQQIHARIVTALEEKFPDIVVSQPALLAHHCTEAGLIEKAIEYWLNAGQQSVARSAMPEAVVQLRKGLDLLASLPETSWSQLLELDLQVTLEPALFATKGFADSNVGQAISRGRSLAEQLGRPEYLVPLLYGEWAFHLFRAELRLALSFAEQMQKTAETRNDAAALLLGRLENAITCSFLGEFLAARALCDHCHRLRDPAHRSIYATVTAEDPYTVMLAHLASILTCLGYVDLGRAKLAEALREARRLEHACTLTVALSIACWVDWATNSPDDAQQHAKEIIALSKEHGFPHRLGTGTVHWGSSLIALGQTQEGLSFLKQGLSVIRSTGTVSGTPFMLTKLADCHARLGGYEEGLACLANAAQIIETAEERRDEAELHRVRGDVFNKMGNPTAAEQNYQQALAVAKRQSAKVFELRAATSIAHLWRDQGKCREARDLLAPVYNWFTEGFDTPVLKEAKALLDSLQ